MLKIIFINNFEKKFMLGKIVLFNHLLFFVIKMDILDTNVYPLKNPPFFVSTIITFYHQVEIKIFKQIIKEDIQKHKKTGWRIF